MKKANKTREEWLMQMTRAMKPMFKKAGYPIPDTVKVSCSFPGGGRPTQRIGEAWPAEMSEGKYLELFISPVLSDTMRVADVLCHELVHAAVGNEHGHRGPFAKVARFMKLEGKLTATRGGDEFKEWVKPLVDKLGEYPHAKLNLAARKKQGTRLVKVECQNGGCEAEGYKARVTRKWLDDFGAPRCPCCDEPMTEAV